MYLRLKLYYKFQHYQKEEEKNNKIKWGNNKIFPQKN